MEPTERVVIVGAGEQAEIAYEYFTHDSPHDVVAFAVERAYLGEERVLYGLPIVPLEEIAERYDPAEYRAFVAVSSTHLNRVRERLFNDVRARGYRCVSYVSSRAFRWHNVEVGENSFVFEGNVLQHHVRIGDNVILWSGNHVGHRTVIEDHVFVSSHVVISGFCRIGTRSFMGVNACVGDGRTIGADCVIGAGAVIVRDTEPLGVYVGNPARPTGRSALQAFGVPDAA